MSILFDMGRAAGLFVCLALALDPATARAATHQDVPLKLTILTRGDKGRVYCAVWSGKDGYPMKREKARYEGRTEAPVGKRAQLDLTVAAGAPYAIACFHDENGNQTMDRNFLGIPSEGTGASNNARNPFGPPGYSDARFVVTATTSMTIKINY